MNSMQIPEPIIRLQSYAVQSTALLHALILFEKDFRTADVQSYVKSISYQKIFGD